MKRNIFLIIFSITAVHVQAQFGDDYLKAAEKYYQAADYASAATYYEKYLQAGTKGSTKEFDPYEVTIAKKLAKQSGSDQAVYHLAESYRLLTNFEKAEPVYKQLLQASPEITPLAYYHFASVLRAQAKYAEAEQSLNIFLDKYKTQDEYVEAAKRELQNLRYIQQQLSSKDSSRYAIQKITAGREGASYAPVYAPDNTLLFTATWPDTTARSKPRHTNHILQANYTGNEVSNITALGLPASNFQEATPALSEDGNTLYLTRWKIVEGKKSAAVYKCTKTGDKWSEPIALNAVVNEPGANAQQPVLMSNGKYLLYASDKKGGFGGYDIWCAELNSNGEPVSTTNLGETINTGFNEEAPFYHAGSSCLVFTTNGRVGMGGYDLFYSIGQPGNWQQPVNLGYPVNSVKDDMYFTTRQSSDKLLEYAFFSSDRTATCCLELFHVTQTPEPVVENISKDTTVSEPVVTVPKKKQLFEDKPLEVRNILFGYNNAMVNKDDYSFLDEVAAYLKANPQAKIEIGAHTDGIGSVEYNLKLSARRAQSCMNYLVNAGVDKKRLVAKGYGECCPLMPEMTTDKKDIPEAREKNRRIEIKLL